ncbi:hypothetical protein FRC11_005327 [Ceratobasidium sp. 423]|nr:hypothetical protein FRC11_005327 [Ceratobasidium sp. 423]
MAERRITARHAGRNVFVDYLDRLCGEDRLTKCLTTSIDALEAASSADLALRVVQLYGDNRLVRCLMPECDRLNPQQTSALDNELLALNPLMCQKCQDEENPMPRRTGNDANRLLRPAVQHRVGLSFTPVETVIDDDQDQEDDYVDEPDPTPVVGKGKGPASRKKKHPSDYSRESSAKSQHKAAVKGQRKARPRRKRHTPIEFAPPDATAIAGYDGGSHLFLIVGAPPKDVDLLNVIRDLATSVHGRDGAVVYIDPAPLHGSSQHDHIHIHLQADIQETLGQVIQQMQRRPSHSEGEVGNDADLWFDLIQNEIPVRYTDKEKLVQDEDSDDEKAEPGEATRGIYPPPETFQEMPTDQMAELSQPVGPPQGGSTSQAPDEFPFHEACVAFNMFSHSKPRPPVTEACKSFVCPKCWNYTEWGLYPLKHYIRPVLRESVELQTAQWPRLAMVVYYVEQFWPQTKHLINLTTGFWRQLGWEYKVEPVKLQQLQEKKDAFVNFYAAYKANGRRGRTKLSQCISRMG